MVRLADDYSAKNSDVIVKLPNRYYYKTNATISNEVSVVAKPAVKDDVSAVYKNFVSEANIL